MYNIESALKVLDRDARLGGFPVEVFFCIMGVKNNVYVLSSFLICKGNGFHTALAGFFCGNLGVKG